MVWLYGLVAGEINMKKSEVPKDVLAAIRKEAEGYWDNDAEMMKDRVDTEVSSYIALQNVNFGAASAVRQEILDNADESADSWEERFSVVENEIAAFQELHEALFKKVPDALIRKFKAEAAQEHEGDYSSQRDHVANDVRGYLYVQELKAQIGPVSVLLTKMERIIGSECYNGKIQNYGPGGVWEGEGRSFRYPVKFLDGGEARKHWSVPADIPPEVLVTGWYQFGSNELSIFRALAKIVDMIEHDYGVRLTDTMLKK